MGIGHSLLHRDTLADELEALGLGAALYWPLVRARGFYCLVPQQAGVFPSRAQTWGGEEEPHSFARASQALYRDGVGLLRWAAADVQRFDHDAAGNALGFTDEPAATNLTTAFNVQPDPALSNLTKTGPGTMSRVDDAGALAGAGFGIIGNGFAVELDNSGGGAESKIAIGGATANAADHAISGWVRVTTGTGAFLRLDTSAVSTPAVSDATWTRVFARGAALIGEQLELVCPAGCTARFIGWQLEEAPVDSSLIETQGASAARAMDLLQWPQRVDAIRDDEGTVYFRWRPGFINSDYTTQNTRQLVSVRSSGTASSMLGHRNLSSTGNARIISQDTGSQIGINLQQGTRPVRDGIYHIFLRWKATRDLLIIEPDGRWTELNGQTYAGSWHSGGPTTIMHDPGAGLKLPVHMGPVTVWDRALSREQIADLMTPGTPPP